jgi:hypothetical protein
MNMEMPPMSAQKPDVRREQPRGTIPDDLRHALEEDRKISHGDYGEGPKSVSVASGGKTYKFENNRTREQSPWTMDVSDEHGEWIETVDVTDDASVEFLEALFSQDIPDSIRHDLLEHGEVSHEEHGDKKVVSVERGGKTYKFYRDNREYADWAMDTVDENGNWVDTVDVREPADVEFLEQLFDKPSQES